MRRTQPNGRVLGVDIIPAQPPKGVSTVQGNFLSPAIQSYIREFLRDPNRGRPYSPTINTDNEASSDQSAAADGYIDRGRKVLSQSSDNSTNSVDVGSDKTVDVVLSDMCAPWDQTTGFWKRSLSEPYRRMMNTTGVAFKDHAGSMVGVARAKKTRENH